ncbi:MAG: hypothetical protein OEO23_14635, partial [Gemmatimonadota bacterium]|nr:hypothetical protein [Gemmatimonadota bacterium]
SSVQGEGSPQDSGVRVPHGRGAPRQELVIVADSDISTTGRLYAMYLVDGAWTQAAQPIPVVFGWGGVGPKREGDGRSPQGRFRLGDAFGYEAQGPRGVRLPYEPLAPGSVCVDDDRSDLYNQIVSLEEQGDRFVSSEPMRRDLVLGDDLYEWGIMVGYNEEGSRDPETDVGLGSCIFLHVWRGPASPTAGCTAMSRADLLHLMMWLDPTAAPAIVQGSRAFLERLHAEGDLAYPVPSD